MGQVTGFTGHTEGAGVRINSVMSRRGGGRRESGASLVEFALIAPLFFAIVLGMITGGFALSKKNSLTNAVREGGRLGATLYDDDASWTWDTWADDVKDRVVEVAGGDLAANEVCVQMVDTKDTALTSDDVVLGKYPTSGCSSSTMPGPPATPASAGGCLVKVWARTKADLETIFFSRELSLDGKALGLYERDKCP